MKRARHQLVLLGFVCQGLSFDDYVLSAAYALLWLLCLYAARRNVVSSPSWEGFLMLAGCALGYAMSRVLDRNLQFFLGHGLALVQAARLMRPLARREKIVVLLIAVFHIAVACTFVFDLRFIPILAAAVVLIPRALVELEAESFPDPAPLTRPLTIPEPGRPQQRRARHWWDRLLARRPARRLGGAAPAAAAEDAALPPGARGPIARALACGVAVYGLIVVVMALFFLTFPRTLIRTPLTSAGGGEAGTMLDTVLDPARSVAAQSSRVLLHIEGERLGYLRCFSLTEFDGSQWTTAPRAPLRAIAYVPTNTLGGYLHRQVRVKNPMLLSRLLPTDGRVVAIQGRFFGRPLQNSHGGIMADSMWSSGKNVYDYWSDPRPDTEPLSLGQARVCLRTPPLSARAQAWLEEVTAGVTNSYVQARRLEGFLRGHFTYELGVPSLSRSNVLEDFLFNEKRGHCERFAAILAQLLRSRGIPSRVVIGYVPTSRNFFTGGYNVRFKDAHAWTEAFFPARGWVQLDATPGASGANESWSVRDAFADLDFAWTSYVVSLDAPAQLQLFSLSFQTLKQAPVLLAQHWEWLGVLVLAALAGALWRQVRRRGPRRPVRVRRSRSVELAAHFYGRMLRALARRGVHRAAQHTPFEFVGASGVQAIPCLPEVRRLTELFCAVRYGQRVLTPAESREVELMLAAIARAK